VDNSYSRVAAWFPVLESIKKKHCFEENLLILAVLAVM
jgi:hypothetical protein